MILLSKTTDYYDRLIHTYGRDTRLIFKREFEFDKAIIDINKYDICRQCEFQDYPQRTKAKSKRYFEWIPIIFEEKQIIFRLSVMFIAGNLVSIITINTEKDGILRSVLGMSDLPIHRYLSDMIEGYSQYRYALDRYKHFSELNLSKPSHESDYFKLAKEVNCPIYEIDHCKPIPAIRLESISGFIKVFPPEQIYQQISCFIGQQLTSIEPPVVIEDSFKIESHGFDKKTSFRKRN
jgi:hypothetical protein